MQWHLHSMIVWNLQWLSMLFHCRKPCRRPNRLSKYPQTYSKRRTNATKCHLVLLYKAEDFHLEYCSIVPIIAPNLFQTSCSLLRIKWILILEKTNVLPHSCCMLSIGVATPNTTHHQALNLSVHSQINAILYFIIVKFYHKTALTSKSLMQFILCFLKNNSKHL